MGSVHEVIEAFRQAPSNSERGTKFEELMVRYFQLDPLLSQEYEQVCRWIDWPDRGGKQDTGIDLVARARDTGEYTAIQCKFYEPTHMLAKSDIDSFFTASGKKPFTNRIIISTTDRWGRNAEDALDGQTIPVQRIGLAEIAESPIDWDVAWPQGELQVGLSEATRHDPHPHQAEAIEAVFDGFAAGHDRGKLIMACGTGKTFTALKIAERVADENGGAAKILFAVPSISLLSQTLREWTAQSQLDLRAFAVCSDTKVSRAAEDIGSVDVAIPVTTNPEQLAVDMGHRKRAKGLTVVFTTYQSLPVVAAAQKQGVDGFDLVICDEAHRTTGVTLAGEDTSNFQRVHDADYLTATRRLYMTATPRLFDDKVKDQAAEHSAELSSMDDEAIYGPEFHRLSFGAAVDRGLLTDYKVIVLTVDEDLVAAPLQQQLAGEFSELKLDDASKIVGCWNGLAKRAGRTPGGTGFTPGEAPMRRAVVFAKDIAASKQVANVFPAVVDAYRDLIEDSTNDGADNNRDLACVAHHVDGTYNALQRNAELSWLKAPVPEGECRILTNARCLSEGVDVPALDAVMFLNPRNSVVDVVQSVGRVMRKADGKDYGYIILPVAVPAGVAPSQALSDNQRFKVVWQVLNALRAHDDRFNAMVNSIALNATTEAKQTGKGSTMLMGDHIGPVSGDDTTVASEGESTTESTDTGSTSGTDTGAHMAQQMALFSLSEWQEAIVARIVDKVGTRAYWEDWAADVAGIAATLDTRIKAVLNNAASEVSVAFEQFHQGLRDNLNDSISREDAINMLSQHLITKPVFDALFADHDFASHNPVSQVMEAMVATLGGAGLEAETAKLDGFYTAVRTRAAEVTTADGKQKVIAELYEKFFRIGFPRQAEALGIVYTPVEVVDFILRAANQASRDAFGRGLTDENVHILDPFTGTGTFITRLLQSGLIFPEDLARKYATELHANEIMLLAYYIAAVNIETTYHALTRAEDAADYTPFEGIVLADTFQITEAGDSMDAIMFPQNNDRIIKQLAAPINVIIGNPPYSVGQASANDLNANVAYPTLDGRIGETYAARSTATNKNSLYDSYLRAFRWATDRIGDAGIVAFVSNGGWIDGNTADGMRLSLADEYTRIYVYNLRGNQRTAGELSRMEGGKIFGSGSRNTVAVFIGVKNPADAGQCALFYRDIGDYLSREEKLAQVGADTLASIDWQKVTPNPHGDWINQRNDEYFTWPMMGEKKASGVTVFESYSSGLKTGRDAWCYNFSRDGLVDAIDVFMRQYESAHNRFVAYCNKEGESKPTTDTVAEFLRKNDDLTETGKISWNRGLRNDLAKGTKITYSEDAIRLGSYRPFNSQWTYLDRRVNDMIYRIPSIFPTPHHTNLGILVTSPGGNAPFTCRVTSTVPDLVSVTGAGNAAQYFPRWTYTKEEASDGGLDFAAAEPGADVDRYGYRRVDNITDSILTAYQSAIGDGVSKDDIFFYVYGLLHAPTYRETYAADLKKALPHIPNPSTRSRFEQLVAAGRQLADLHIGYDTAEPYELDVQVKGADPEDRETWRVSKLKWGKRKDPDTGKSVEDRTTIVYNTKITITGIPNDAERYMLGARSALAWIIDRYQVRTDKASEITNDPNNWCDEHDDPTYIVDLIRRVTTVAVETMRIVDSLE